MISKEWLRIGRPWPSLNELLTIHWRGKQQWRDYFRIQARAEILSRMVQIPEPLDIYIAHLQLLRVSSKELDPTDNLPGGAKPLIDALKATRVTAFNQKPKRPDGYPERYWGLFADDNKKFLKAKVFQTTTRIEADHGSYIKINWKRLSNDIH